ncbi:MAG: hypothetical protein Q8L48_00925 [Archangium sp.]|nr:hypothetical protein [Archangium sp.]
MNLDDKLKSWRDATEPLVPSEKLLAALAATVEAPTTPPAGASAVVKGLIVTAVVGVIGVAVLHAQQVGWGWFAKKDAPPVSAQGDRLVPPARTPDASIDAGEAPCGPRLESAMALTPGLSPEAERARYTQAMRLLTKRPLTCLAQRRPLDQLLWGRTSNDAEVTRLISRLGYLCGAPAIPQWALFQDTAPCDDSDWCHVPSCELKSEACAASWAARRAGTCAHRLGTRASLTFACVRFLRGQGTEAQVRALAADAWCLRPEALKEREYLSQHDAGMELP